MSLIDRYHKGEIQYKLFKASHPRTPCMSFNVHPSSPYMGILKVKI